MLAIDQLTFDKDVITGVNFGGIVRRRPVCNTGMPLSLLLPRTVRILVSLGCRNGQLCDALAVLSRTIPGIFAGESCDGYSINRHGFWSFLEWDLGCAMQPLPDR